MAAPCSWWRRAACAGSAWPRRTCTRAAAAGCPCVLNDAASAACDSMRSVRVGGVRMAGPALPGVLPGGLTHLMTHLVSTWVSGRGRSSRQRTLGGRWASREGLPGPTRGKSEESECGSGGRWSRAEGQGSRCSSRLLAECRHLSKPRERGREGGQAAPSRGAEGVVCLAGADP